MLRKGISIILVAAIIVLCIGTPLQTDAETGALPTALKGVTYKFNDNVKFLDISNMVRIGENWLPIYGCQ